MRISQLLPLLPLAVGVQLDSGIESLDRRNLAMITTLPECAVSCNLFHGTRQRNNGDAHNRIVTVSLSCHGQIDMHLDRPGLHLRDAVHRTTGVGLHCAVVHGYGSFPCVQPVLMQVFY